MTTATTTVTVEERVINVTLTASPTNPAVNTVVQFTATASGTNIVTYNWNLGDGDTRVTHRADHQQGLRHRRAAARSRSKSSTPSVSAAKPVIEIVVQ